MVSLYQLGELQEEVSPLGRRQLRPFAFEGLAGCTDGDIDIRLGSTLEDDNLLLGPNKDNVNSSVGGTDVTWIEGEGGGLLTWG